MATIYTTDPLRLGELTTYPLGSRKSKVSVADFARRASGASLTGWFDALPNLLAAQDLRALLAAIALTGAGLVHDFEIALSGQTSEDVEAGLGQGKFGMATETGLFLNQIASTAAFSGIGYGEAAGKFLASRRLDMPHAQASVLYNAYKLE